MIRALELWRLRAETAMRESRQITALVREIRALDPYYADKTDLRIQLDAMKRWRMIVAAARADTDEGYGTGIHDA